MVLSVWYFYIVVAVLGAVIGSFLNVVILRVPEKKSLMFPASHCPVCGESLKWWMNIPVLSYIMLRGRCRYCGSKISLQYPTVEFISAAITLVLYAALGFSYEFAFYLLTFYLLLVIAVVDLNTQLILNSFLLIWVLLIIAGAYADIFVIEWNWVWGISGAVLGGLFMLGIAYLGERMFGKESLGMGDVKFAAAAGLFLGVDLVIPMVLIAAVSALIILLPVYGKKMGQKNVLIPFGPFLCFATTVIMFYGDAYRSFSNTILERLFV